MSPVDTMANYQSALQRINTAETIDKLAKVETSINRVYDAGFFTANQLMRLDDRKVDQYIKLEGVAV